VQRNVTCADVADVVPHSKVKEEIANSSTQMAASSQGQSATVVRVGIPRAMSPVSAASDFPQENQDLR